MMITGVIQTGDKLEKFQSGSFSNFCREIVEFQFIASDVVTGGKFSPASLILAIFEELNSERPTLVFFLAPTKTLQSPII
jgi:hypothetical protein